MERSLGLSIYSKWTRNTSNKLKQQLVFERKVVVFGTKYVGYLVCMLKQWQKENPLSALQNWNWWSKSPFQLSWKTNDQAFQEWTSIRIPEVIQILYYKIEKLRKHAVWSFSISPKLSLPQNQKSKHYLSNPSPQLPQTLGYLSPEFALDLYWLFSAYFPKICRLWLSLPFAPYPALSEF